jgi:uncharacterized protein YecT (DUF1311 family)
VSAVLTDAFANLSPIEEKTMARHIALALLLTPSFVQAQTGPSFDCSKAGNEVEKTICADAGLSGLDRVLTARYGAALQAAKALGIGAPQSERDLRAFQRGWVKGRDDCWKSDDLRACVEASYVRREAELVTQWMLDNPVGVDVWICDGNPANEVVTFYFETTRPSVRFERGDAIDTGILNQTASGALYTGSFGRSIWVKGSEATYRDPDPGGASYQCVKAQN